MQVFEFHFNPKAKTDSSFDSFCYEPENIYEKKKEAIHEIFKQLDKDICAQCKARIFLECRSLAPPAEHLEPL